MNWGSVVISLFQQLSINIAIGRNLRPDKFKDGQEPKK